MGSTNPNSKAYEEAVDSRDSDAGPDAETGMEIASDAEVERIYVKLDRRIIPALWTLYFLCAAIRSNVGLALTMNSSTGDSLSQRLHLSGHQISTGLALFYVCYVVFDFPSNLIMSKLSPHVWLSRIVLCVGIVGACHAALSAVWNYYLIRLILGIVIAGMWPGMAYYVTLFYPPSLTGKRIGYYFTAAQVSAAVVSLVSAGFQKMNGYGGLVGYEWMFLIYGLVTAIDAILLLWWLPDRPFPPGESRKLRWYYRYLPRQVPALATERDRKVHYEEMTRVYHAPPWGIRDLGKVMLDWRIWPLTVMYFGVVGVGIGVQNYGTLIIRATNPKLTSVQLSLLFAPIWVMDLIAILIAMPLSDRFNKKRPFIFSFGCTVQIIGLCMTTFASAPWTRYGGLLLVGFGLGPTTPNVMVWTSEIFSRRHGEVGVAAASALVSGLGNLGSVTTTYALYTGWASDNVPGPRQYRKSNIVMIAILATSILSSMVLKTLLHFIDDKNVEDPQNMDRAAIREREREERGLRGTRQ
ncbi:Vitamin H transporter [Drechslerella dactyloides]|uniref:Vitamin H transporter n=1 Tax=Drechslerella dactyloides TaxID=74499 RepID=A0AAD6IS12_DREDA|nr:Vitamin H transporter [Drechslerella dactyloides]